MNYSEESLKRHRETRGKLAVVSKMPLNTIEDLSIAYTPGVAAVSLAIAADKKQSFELTNRGNTVAVVTDGSAVLGIGNVGPEAALPVMEGKAILFKGLADVDAYPICLATQDNDEIIRIVKALVPGLGGVNLEDIAAPRCFVIEDALQDIGIPVMHDDQHGTAIVTLAALRNALKVTGKKIETVRIVFSGAGAAGIATTRLLLEYGARNIILVDSKGIIHKGRSDLNGVKIAMLEVTNQQNLTGSLADAMRGADVFIGVSAAGALTKEMVRTMAKDAIVFAMANPVPEIMPAEAKAAGAAVVGTGRSDFPNQINNCLAFPGIFRGALDSGATRITTQMKLAAAIALADLVEHPTAERVIPWALDKAVVPAVAKAVMDVARGAGAAGGGRAVASKAGAGRR
ncbi:MAG: NADP-dependent malic enzyme [Dehalococcoidia bacterium]|nr:NADP-dependent malic enzyme [Dehalococcoidia bacterium]